MTKTETDQIREKIDALQEQLLTLQDTPIDVNGTPEEVLAAATATVTRQQNVQAIKEAIASLQTALYVKEQEKSAKEAETALDAIKRQARITASKLEQAQSALVELQRVAAPHLRICRDTFGQLALQNHLDPNTGFPVVEIRDKCVVISVRY